MHQPTIEKLHALRLGAMADALTAQLQQPEIDAMPFAERLALLVDIQHSAPSGLVQDRLLNTPAISARPVGRSRRRHLVQRRLSAARVPSSPTRGIGPIGSPIGATTAPRALRLPLSARSQGYSMRRLFQPTWVLGKWPGCPTSPSRQPTRVRRIASRSALARSRD
jgi:hypothetical protein